MSNPRTIEIIDKLSTYSYRSLSEMLGKHFDTIYLYGKKSISRFDHKLVGSFFYCNYLMFEYKHQENSNSSVSFSQKFINKDTWTAYSKIEIRSGSLDKSIGENSLNNCCHTVSLPESLKFISADVYGILCQDFVLDEEIEHPFTKTLISNNSDCMIKLNFNESNFILIWAKDGSITIAFGHSKESLEEYLSMTRSVWGEHKGYRYKYSIK